MSNVLDASTDTVAPVVEDSSQATAFQLSSYVTSSSQLRPEYAASWTTMAEPAQSSLSAPSLANTSAVPMKNQVALLFAGAKLKREALAELTLFCNARNWERFELMPFLDTFDAEKTFNDVTDTLHSGLTRPREHGTPDKDPRGPFFRSESSSWNQTEVLRWTTPHGATRSLDTSVKVAPPPYSVTSSYLPEVENVRSKASHSD